MRGNGGVGLDGRVVDGRGGGKRVGVRGENGGVPSMINHSGFLTLSESGWGSRSDSQFVSSASLISSLVRWRMKTGLPRHLMMTCESLSAIMNGPAKRWVGLGVEQRSVGRTHVLAFGYSSQIDLNLRLGKDVGGGGHVDKEICGPNMSALGLSHAHLRSFEMPTAGTHKLTLYSSLRSGGSQQAHTAHHEILECLVSRFPFTAHVLRKVRYSCRRVLI